jgi:hypothetical protein
VSLDPRDAQWKKGQDKGKFNAIFSTRERTRLFERSSTPLSAIFLNCSVTFRRSVLDVDVCIFGALFLAMLYFLGDESRISEGTLIALDLH